MSNNNGMVDFKPAEPMTLERAFELIEPVKKSPVCYCQDCPVCAFNYLKNVLPANVSQEDKEVFKEMLKANGYYYYLGAVQEECSEVIQAINHIRRKRKDAVDETIKEIAQLFIVMETLKIALFPIDQEESLFREVFDKELKRIKYGVDNGLVHVAEK